MILGNSNKELPFTDEEINRAIDKIGHQSKDHMEVIIELLLTLILALSTKYGYTKEEAGKKRGATTGRRTGRSRNRK